MLQRFGNMAGVFQVMAFSVGALEKGESDAVFMGKLAKIATAEIISSKVCCESSTIVKDFLFMLCIVRLIYVMNIDMQFQKFNILFEMHKWYFVAFHSWNFLF